MIDMINFSKGQTVFRQDPGGHELSFTIKSDQDIAYHTDLQARGYKYTIPEEADFELPTVEGTAPSAPRVHIGGDVCIACES
jgi:hypothetical protein